VSTIIETLRAIIRDELVRQRSAEIGKVTQVFPKASDDAADNHQVNLTLRPSGVELERVPVLVSRYGVSALPREGDLMAVLFIGGELNAPIAFGCLYNDQDHPPKAGQNEVVYQPPDEAESGVRRLYVELPSGTKITLDDDVLDIQSGDTTVTINRDGDVVINAKGKLQLESQSDIELTAQGDLKLSAQGNVSISGTSAKLEGKSDAKVSGPQLTLAGMTQFSAS
jgi:phage baseplate assembly protein gpV